MLNDNFTQLDNFHNLHYAISQTKDGNMSFKWGDKEDVLNNRQNFFHKLNLDMEKGIMMSVQYETDIVIVKDSQLGAGMKNLQSALKVDALMTDKPNVILCLLTADCMPIIFYDPKNQAIALAHLGWQGTEGRLSPKVIKKMSTHFDTNPEDLIVAIGPSIHKESYVYWYGSPPQKEFPGWEPYIDESPDGQSRIDVIGYNYRQLLDAGVPEKNIDLSRVNTAKSTKYFSHHRAIKDHKPNGRFMTIVSMVDSQSTYDLSFHHACRKDYFIAKGMTPPDEVPF